MLLVVSHCLFVIIYLRHKLYMSKVFGNSVVTFMLSLPATQKHVHTKITHFFGLNKNYETKYMLL